MEIEPREVSGIIPSDWVALLGLRAGPGAASTRTVRGISYPKLRDLPALAGGVPRDYSCEAFWVVFPAKGEDGQPLFSSADKEAELSVRIHGKPGRVRWAVPDYVRGRP